MQILSMLKNGQQVRIITSTEKIIPISEKLVINQILGKGTQGHVYSVSLPDKSNLALKLYHQATLESDTTLEKRIIKLVNIGSPSAHFCWALEFISVETIEDSSRKFKGYLMPLQATDFISPTKFLNGQIKMDFKYLFKACLNLSEAFSSLHLKGLCYKDVSINNFFFNPHNGKCSVIDIDNICYDNDFDYSHTVLGTPRFMAPEIVEGVSRPTIHSDNHSLAVLLFYLLLVGHPLEGEKEKNIKIFDIAAQKFLYGSNATYIFDLTNDSNRPDPIVHSACLTMAEILPEFIMKIFNDAFTTSLHNPNARIPDSKWSIELKRLIDLTSHCTNCGQEIFLSSLDVDSIICWSCGADVKPIKISIDDSYCIASPGHVLKLKDGTEYGLVVRHPSDPKILGLKNLSPEVWKVKASGKAEKMIHTGMSAALGEGVSIDTNGLVAKLIEIN